jgi:predicted signal transduction protein with EAL and GGDEF domain
MPSLDSLLGLLPIGLSLVAATMVALGIKLVRQRVAGPLGPSVVSERHQLVVAAAVFAEIAFWLACYAAELTLPEADAVWTHRFSYLAIAALPPTVLSTALGVHLARTPPARLTAALFAIPIASAVLSLTNGWQGWLWSSRGMVAVGPLAAVDVVHGPWFVVHTAWSYGCLTLAYAMLLHHYLQIGGRRFFEIGMLTAAFVAPLGANFVHLFLAEAPGLDLTPLGLTVTASTLGWVLRRDWVKEFLPIAWSQVMNRLGDAVLVVDERDRVVDLNEAGRSFVVAPAGLPGENRAVLAADLSEAIGRDATRVAFDSREHPPRHYDVRVERFSLATGQRVRAISIRDVSDLRRVEHHARRLAYFDPLTGLPNRRSFHEQLEQAVLGREETRFAVLLVSIDRFGRFSESLGHAAGDELARQLARRVDAAFRTSAPQPSPQEDGKLRRPPVLARVGDGDFAVWVPEARDVAYAERLARSLLEIGERSMRIEGEEVFGRVSVGVAMFPEHGRTPDALLRAADRAMWEARRSRAGYRLYDPAREPVAPGGLQLESELRRALDLGEFELHYQPVRAAATGFLVGAEALLRWRRGGTELVTAASFIQLAEETELVIPIGRWALGEVCRQQRKWRDQGLDPVPVYFNVSSVQLANDAFPERVVEAIAASGIPARDIGIELTERAVVENEARGIAILEALRAAGVGLALDDFGTGYSSLSQLHRLPFHHVKIDGSFVRRLGEEAAAARLTRAIIDMSHGLGLTVIAECVETAEQGRILAEQGCDQLQGWWCGRPAEPEAFAEILRGEGIGADR